MNLIIAEKPSLARNIIAGIAKVQKDEMVKKNGYYEGGNYCVTWAFGHLFSLADIEEYSPSATGRWSMDNLPCFPTEFKFQLKKSDKDKKEVDAGVKKQFETIKYLCNRENIDTIINAGDSDREGEIIVRLCVRYAEPKEKKFVRLWLPDQTPETIKEALSEMKDESEYQPLANEGFARTYIDWLYGVNLTRYATLKTGKLLRVGRVIIPIVKAIYDRDMEIRNFKPEKYYVLTSHAQTNGQVVDLTSKIKFKQDELEKCQALANQYNTCIAKVVSAKSKKDSLAPPKLYSLSKLQNYLGKKYKMSMDESLAIVQKLYEEGYVTYPRTNSEYLATAEQGKMKSILENLKKIGYPVSFKFKKTIFDDSKIESHSALTPTYKIPATNALSEKEKQVYSAILRRFVANFCDEECICEKGEIKIAVGDLEDFLLKGTIILQKGWTKFDDNVSKDKIIPKLAEGDTVAIHFEPTEKETTPPKHYTIETLNNYLKNPFKEEKASDEGDDDDYKAIFEGLELGTEATRTGIIKNACVSGYIQLKKDTYTILPDGEYLIHSLSEMGISMDKYKTSELGQALKKVYRGEYTIENGVSLAQNEIQAIFDVSKDVAVEQDTDIGLFGDVVGTCPLCKEGTVVRTGFGYGCNRYKEGCKFTVNKQICHRTISQSNVKLLLATGQTSKIQGFIGKSGKSFDAVLKLDENGKIIFDFS